MLRFNCVASFCGGWDASSAPRNLDNKLSGEIGGVGAGRDGVCFARRFPAPRSKRRFLEEGLVPALDSDRLEAVAVAQQPLSPSTPCCCLQQQVRTEAVVAGDVVHRGGAGAGGTEDSDFSSGTHASCHLGRTYTTGNSRF